MKSILILLFSILFSLQSKAQIKEHLFEVIYRGQAIGNLFALEKPNTKGIIRDLRTNTDVDLFAFSVHVESEVKMLKKEGKLLLSSCYRHANRGTEEILAQIKKIGPKEYTVKRNGEEFKLENKEISYCTVDLYFNEPKGIDAVFSSMFADFLKLEEIEPNRYKLSSPKSKDTYYTYKNGELILVEIDTPMGMTSCNRIK